MDKTCNDVHCIFCNRTANDAFLCVSDKSNWGICSFCLENCNRLTNYRYVSHQEETASKPEQPSYPGSAPEQSLIKPAEIKAHLDQHVVGQEGAKKTLAVAIYNHYKRISAVKKDTEDDVVIGKSNILMLGATGSGKTYLAKTIAKIMDVPFVIADATSLTAAGYVGGDVEEILQRLVTEAGGDVQKAERGIVYIDEIDKLSQRVGDSTSQKGVSTGAVQQALLKMIEGSVVTLPQKSNDMFTMRDKTINTENILFICGGAFDGIEKISKQRSQKPSLGFIRPNTDHENPSDTSMDMATEDLYQYGLIPEFIGRLPIVVQLDELTEDELVRILTEPKNSLVKQYERLFQIDGVQLIFTPEALQEIAQRAIKEKTGARGLRSVVERVLTNVMYEIPSIGAEKVEITASAVRRQEEPKIIYAPKEKTKRGFFSWRDSSVMSAIHD